jgi:hypothetical protein
MKREEFKEWLEKKYTNLQKVTVTTTVSDAFFIFNHNVGITFNDLLSGAKTLDDYRESVRQYLVFKGKNPGNRPSGYASHMKYLLEYASEIGLTDIDLTIKNKKVRNKKLLTPKKITFHIEPYHVEKAFSQVESDPVYGAESRAINKVLNLYPKHDSLEEVLCKIAIIDITHSTHVGIHKKKFSIVDLANAIMNISNIDARLELGDKSLVDEISNVNGVNLLSFASKYCACHNQMIYKRDDYYKFDSVVSKAISFRKRNYTEYSKVLDSIAGSNHLTSITNFRMKLDYYFWYNNK